jgi:hypothetical protein
MELKNVSAKEVESIDQILERKALFKPIVLSAHWTILHTTIRRRCMGRVLESPAMIIVVLLHKEENCLEKLKLKALLTQWQRGLTTLRSIMGEGVVEEEDQHFVSL